MILHPLISTLTVTSFPYTTLFRSDAFGCAAATAVVDFAGPEGGDRIVEAALAHMGGIDAVISNAGIIMGGALVDLGLAEFDKIFAINTRATWLIGKAAHPHLKASKGAFIAKIGRAHV